MPAEPIGERLSNDEVLEARRLTARARMLSQLASTEIERSRELMIGCHDRFRRSRQRLRHLPGEDLGTRAVEDAWHWAGVYRELLRAVELLDDEGCGRPEEIRLRVWRLRLQRRLRYWEERSQVLASQPPLS